MLQQLVDSGNHESVVTTAHLLPMAGRWPLVTRVVVSLNGRGMVCIDPSLIEHTNQQRLAVRVALRGIKGEPMTQKSLMSRYF